MNKKERILAAMKLKNVDKIPVLYRGVTPFTKRLMDYFGIGKADGPVLLPAHYKELLKAINADNWGIGARQYFSNFVPVYIGPDIDYRDQSYFSTTGIKTATKHLDKYNYDYLVIASNPLAGYDEPAKVKGYLTKRLDYFDYKNSINTLLNNGKDSPYFNNKEASKILSYENFINSDEDIISFGGLFNYFFMLCSYLRGMDNFLYDLAGNVKMAEAIIYEVQEFMLEFNRRFLEKTSIKAHCYASWDDVAGQDGLMFSPDTFKKYFLPFWKQLISMVKAKGLLFSWHCCGNVNDVLPMMIDAGIDVFDVLQTSAKDMEIEKFYRKFGSSICVNGAIDVQKLLVYGNPKEIEEEVKRIFSLWGKKGGIIIGPSHEIVPDTPVENVIALYNYINELNCQ